VQIGTSIDKPRKNLLVYACTDNSMCMSRVFSLTLIFAVFSDTFLYGHIYEFLKYENLFSLCCTLISFLSNGLKELNEIGEGKNYCRIERLSFRLETLGLFMYIQ